jgi:hypothetical protein
MLAINSSSFSDQQILPQTKSSQGGAFCLPILNENGLLVLGF